MICNMWCYFIVVLEIDYDECLILFCCIVVGDSRYGGRGLGVGLDLYCWVVDGFFVFDSCC